MSGEWKGWQSWNRYEAAGVVENNLDFSEEPIIVDHAVGRTKKAIKKCWPMDAAVAYSLMKAGPEARLTWSDLVNQHTRAAAVLMTRKVAYGSVPKPNIPSCGHDEVNAAEFTVGGVGFNHDTRHLTFNTSSWGKNTTLSEWLDSNEIAEDHPARACTSFRVKRQAYSTNVTMQTVIATPFFKPLLTLLDEMYDSDYTYSHLNSIIQNRVYTLGECKWKDDHTKTCVHHDEPTESNWALVRDDDGGFVTAYSKGSVSNGWNNNQWRSHNIHHSNVVRWSEVQRSMSAAIPESEVIDAIKPSLLRMLKRNDNIVMKEGRGKNATHWWSDWGWLAEMTAHVKQTNSKKRKEGEIANGWKYTKINSRKSYGHEIAEFVWKPSKEIKDYVLGRKESDDWSASTILRNLRFSTKAQAEAMAESIMAAHLENGGHFAHRQHEGFDKSETKSSWSIRSIDHTNQLVMKSTVQPEDYMSPEAFMTMYRNAAPVVVAEHRDNFTRLPSFTIVDAPKKEAKSDDGQ